MKSCASVLLSALALVSTARAHMALTWPLPFRAEYNPYSNPNQIDYSITSPLNADGSNFPCKGYQADMGTHAGTSVATWETGSQYNYSVGSGALHGGGSCQAALSYDNGTSFTVIHSYIGSCPIAFGQKFNFNVPSDAPTGSAMFGWVWYNVIGNREIYMDCASVTITGGSKRDAPAVAFKDRPSLFVANLGNGCTTVEGKEVEYPNPGPDVTTNKTVKDDSGSFTGTCQPVKGIGIGADSASGSAGSGTSNSTGSGPAASASSGSSVGTSSAASVAASPSTSSSAAVTISSSASPATANTPSTMSTVFVSKTTSSSTQSSASTAVSAGSSGTSTSSGSSAGLTVTEDGECSGSYTCNGSIHGPCCSQWGWCGSTSDYCGTGCQSAFGQCGTFLNSTTPATPSSSSAAAAVPSSASVGNGSTPATISAVAVSASTSLAAASAAAEPSGGVFTTAMVKL